MLFTEKSLREKGTLYHLKVLLNYKKVNLHKAKIADFNAADDFFKIIVSSHIVTAAMELLHMSSIDDQPIHDCFQLSEDDLKDQSAEQRYDAIYSVSSEIVKQYVDLSTDESLTTHADDGVLEYSKLLMSCGLLYLEFCDGIKEGDGFRILRCWKYMFLLFKASNRVNYAIEAFNLLAQYHFLLSQRHAHQLLWSRFINVHGLPGRNIPCDLYMEHLNRVCKDAVEHLKSNKSSRKALERVAKVVGIINRTLHQFNDDNEIKPISGKHSVADYQQDVRKVVTVFFQENVMKYQGSRSHASFRNVKGNPICRIDRESLISWMYAQINLLIQGF